MSGTLIRLLPYFLLQVHEKPNAWAEVWLSFQDKLGEYIGHINAYYYYIRYEPCIHLFTARETACMAVLKCIKCRLGDAQ